MEKKRKVSSDSKQRPDRKAGTKSISRTSNGSRKFDDARKKRRTGPRIPAALRKELDKLNPDHQFREEGVEGDANSSDEGNDDLYEYEEAVAEEESQRNRRYDPVENYEYKLPDEFKDENIESDDEEDEYDGSKIGGNKIGKGNSDPLDDDDEEDYEGRHSMMLQGITGLPSEAFQGKKKKDVVISELYPESEYNPTSDVLDGNGHITIDDLLQDLSGKQGYSEVRKNVRKLDKKATPLLVPLTKDVHDKLDRKAAYEQTQKILSEWELQVKRNREAPSLIFEKDTDFKYSTVGAIASAHEPRTEMEKKMASLVHDDKLKGAHKEDGAKLLELNKIPAEDYVKQRNHVAKMRSLLFRHEVRMKRVKKIKSKTYHRLLKKDNLRSATDDILTDKEAARELEMKQELKRAEERMTLRHKNSSKWAKRIKERGLSVQDDDTLAALAEQHNQHALLTRKMKSLRDSSSSSDDSDDSDEDDDDGMAGSDQDMQSKLLKAKEKTLKLAEDDDEEPKSGVFSLSFMVRADKKRKEAAIGEAKLAIQDYDLSLEQLEDSDAAGNAKVGTVSGRRVFGVSKKQVMESSNKIKLVKNSSDSEDEALSEEDIHDGIGGTNEMKKDVSIKPVLPNNDTVVPQLKASNIDGDSIPKTTYEVAMLVSGAWKKMGSEHDVKTKSNIAEPVTHNQNLEEVGEGSDSESDGQMVDGILSSGHKSSYVLPSQAELIREAFAGDDVVAEFSKDKEELLNEENPEPEKPALIPGWGQWTNVQKRKGLPSWMVEEHETAKRNREEAVKKRKDAHLKHVVISERVDRRTDTLLLRSLPRPFTSNELLERSTRMPIGPEFNPETAGRGLTRPEVVKKPGTSINPIRYEDLEPLEKVVEHNKSGSKQKLKSGSKQKQKRKQKMKSSASSRVKPVVTKC